jgi:hypothetical protein
MVAILGKPREYALFVALAPGDGLGETFLIWGGAS